MEHCDLGVAPNDEVGPQKTAIAGAILLVMALLACGGADHDQLKTRSAFDLKCPEEKIVLKEIDERTIGVIGCGQRATYVESCNGPKYEFASTCTWVLNSDSRPER